MTLVPHTRQSLDELALSFLDLAADARQMAAICRENELESVDLHANKLREWLTRLEDWSRDARRKVELAALRRRGRRRADELAVAETARTRAPRKRGGRAKPTKSAP